MEQKRTPWDSIEIAEHVIAEINGGKYPAVKKFVFDTTYEVRQVVDPTALNQENHEELDNASVPGGIIKLSLNDGSPTVTLYHHLNPKFHSRAVLFSTLMTNVTSLAYGALGFDMTKFKTQIQDSSSK